jgi:hypothetical protein
MTLTKAVHSRFTLALAFILPVIVSCGGAPPPSETPPAGSAEPSAAPAETGAPATPPAASATPATPPAAATWKDMNHDQRMELMKTVVMPKMKTEFADFDAKKYADFKCATCHGDGVKDGSFKMPNPKLPKLSAADGFKKHMAKTPAITKFMMAKVVPDMASMLNEQPYDPATHQGFGCGECHLMEK